MENKNPILQLNNVYSGYGEIEVLQNISLSVQQGSIVSILGANGAGKSTLLKTIFGLIHPTQGQVIFDGVDISNLPTNVILRRGISYVLEGRCNFPAMTVEENLEMGAFIRNDKSAIKDEIDALCNRYPILKEKRHSLVGNLSGGQQQMVETAIGLMLHPKLMLIDEPTLGLAPILVKEIINTIQEINQSGTTILLVEQNAMRALEISDYGFVMELGKIRFSGTANELAQNDDVYRAYLGER